MDQFPFMKECLKKFDYPKIHTLDDVEIAEIFHKSNRQFLICWMLKRLDTDYKEIVEKATKEDLAEILHCNGFCTESEKYSFMNGESAPNTQLEILNTMFKYLDSLQEAKNNDETRVFSNEELKNFINFDTNLFPMFGSLHVLSPTQRQNKIKDYQKEIEILQTFIQTKSSDEVQNVPQLKPQINPNLINELSQEMECLQINLPDFQRKILDILRDREEDRTSHINFKENFCETLESCGENAAMMLNLITNMNIITNFKEASSLGSKDCEGNNRRNNLMRQVSELCNGVTVASHKIFF